MDAPRMLSVAPGLRQGPVMAATTPTLGGQEREGPAHCVCLSLQNLTISYFSDLLDVWPWFWGMLRPLKHCIHIHSFIHQTLIAYVLGSRLCEWMI